MKPSTSLAKPILITLALAASVAFGVHHMLEKAAPEISQPIYHGTVIYLSPTGNDSASGEKSAPMATLKSALKRLPVEEGGTIVLAGGTYTHADEVGGKGGPVVITAAPNAEVIFEGGQQIPKWRPHPTRKGLYIAQLTERESLYGHTDYYDFWDNDDRVRYGKMADEEAVAHRPGSILLLDNNEILFRPHRLADPEELQLWTNRRAKGIDIHRSGVTFENIRFRNFLGGSDARALTVSGCQDVIIKGCHFRNCTIGISSTSENFTVTDCDFREVGMGVRQTNRGGPITVRRSIFESAIGLFAFSDVSEHLSDAIRIYFWSDGATIEQCVTTGFWAGLYIKTTSDERGKRTYTIRNNTFLDGIRSGADCKHPRTTITNNIIGTPRTSEAAGVKAGYYQQMGATLADNFFVGADAPENGDPFEDLLAGDLRLKAGGPRNVGATEITKTAWGERARKHLATKRSEPKPVTKSAQALVTSSRLGAVIVVQYEQPVRARLRYREKGTEVWENAKGRDTTIRPATSMISAIPFEPQEPNEFPWTFALTQGELKPEAIYEYELTATASAGGAAPPQRGTFVTSGPPRQWHIASNAASDGDGTQERPFPTLQQAINRALPGDTLRVAPGLYSDPVLMVHGGTPSARITITGADYHNTIIDGGKQIGTLVELIDAPDVTITQLQFRWFGNYGVVANRSPRLVFEHCWVWNQSFTGTGVCGIGVQLTGCEGSRIAGCLFNRNQSAVIVAQSPKFTFIHNTALGNVYSGLDLVNSARDSVIAYNSLTFTGNRSLFIREADEEAFRTLQCDYNNYASRVREIAPGRPENDFKPAERYGTLTGASKGIVAITMGKDVWRDFHQMKAWREFSGKDAHSLFADPEYIDPRGQDLRLLPITPNRLPNGRIIGALPIAETAAALP